MAHVLRIFRGSIGTEDPAPCTCAKCSPKHDASSEQRSAARSSGTAPSPTTESFIERFRNRTTSTVERIRETLTGDKPAIGPAPRPAISQGAHVPTTAVPPDLNKMIRDRKEK